MARKRFNNYQRPRKSPGSERSYYAYQLDVPAPLTSRAELVRLLRGGEDTYLELKVRFSNVEKLIAEIIALANTAGGAIVFGVNDQLRIEGVEDPESIEEQLRELCAHQIQPPVFPYINKVAFDSGRRIVILEVGTENRPHRTFEDRFYIREGSTKREATREELSKLYHETHLTRFEQVPIFQADTETDIDESLFWSYIRGVNPGYWGESTKGFPTDAVMREMGLVVKISDELIPTIGGLLLFGLNDRVMELIPRADLMLTRFSGNDYNVPIIERTHLRGNLFSLFDGALKFITRYVDLWDSRPSRKARENATTQNDVDTVQVLDDPFLSGRANYHRGSLIEALTNSLVHRDWSARDRQARVNIYDDSIEIINPAQMLELPIISLRYGIACPPNPRLKAIFTNQHYGIPVTRGGIPMICAETINFARRAPEGPSITNGEFRLKIHGLR
ncbi:MAG: putative DNA binding domain-containing protein [Acidobacteria bacterium]|nr:putative DNA binding domain-containing protein [Acidobacteriota bacterium]